MMKSASKSMWSTNDILLLEDIKKKAGKKTGFLEESKKSG